MIGLHWPVFGADRGAFDQRQEIALHAFPADIGTADALGAPADLVDLVEEYEAVVLDVADRFLHGGVVVDELVRLFRHEDLERVADGDAARLGALAERLAENIAQIDHADMAARHAGDLEGWHASAGIGDLDLDFAVVEFAGAQALTEGVAGSEVCAGADQSIDHALLGVQLRLGLDLPALRIAHESDACFQ